MTVGPDRVESSASGSRPAAPMRCTLACIETTCLLRVSGGPGLPAPAAAAAAAGSWPGLCTAAAPIPDCYLPCLQAEHEGRMQGSRRPGSIAAAPGGRRARCSPGGPAARVSMEAAGFPPFFPTLKLLELQLLVWNLASVCRRIPDAAVCSLPCSSLSHAGCA